MHKELKGFFKTINICIHEITTKDQELVKMNTLDTMQKFEVTKIEQGISKKHSVQIATEVPFTIVANNVEIASLMCTPSNLEELTVGFLFTSGFVTDADEIQAYHLDEQQWRADVRLEKNPDPEIMSKRLYTSGCGKGVMYSSMIEITSRQPLGPGFTIKAEAIPKIMKWLLTSSALHKATGGVHTAALSLSGRLPRIAIDDVGRHNALDKVIGKGLLDSIDFSQTLIACTGRTSSEILYKSKRSSIPIILSRGAPTHQTILLAREMNVTVVGFARGRGFTVYTSPDRIELD